MVHVILFDGTSKARAVNEYFTEEVSIKKGISLTPCSVRVIGFLGFMLPLLLLYFVRDISI